MADETIREPERIRADCARKLRSVETGDMFTAILGGLLSEDWSNRVPLQPSVAPCVVGSRSCMESGWVSGGNNMWQTAIRRPWLVTMNCFRN